jgi:RecB family exonuclease
VAGASIGRIAAPETRPIERISPSLGEELRACGLRVAFRLDPRFNEYRKLHPAAALGLVSHELAEAVTRGELDETPDADLGAALSADWDRRIAEKASLLVTEWPLGKVPPPERWPGYQLTRVRLLRRLSEEVRRRRGRAPGVSSSEAEAWLEAPGLPLVGRADRVERSNGDVELVDLKSGWTVGDEIRPGHRRQLLLYAYLWHAMNGDWPRRVSIQRLNGLRSILEVDPREAEAVAADLLGRLETYNGRIAAREAADALASPSDEACAHCAYRPVCLPFFEALDESWGWYRRSLLGEVIGCADVDGAGVMEVRVEASNLGSEVETARILGVPSDLLPPRGSRVAVLDATPTSLTQDVRVAWDSQLVRWD